MGNTGLIVFGVLLLVAGFAALNYQATATQDHLFGLIQTSQTNKPYEPLGAPLMIGGIVLVAVGAAMKK